LSTTTVCEAIEGCASLASFSAELAERHLGEVVELVGVDRVAAGAQLVGLRARGERLAAPVVRGRDVLLVVLLDQAQVADGLRHRALGLGDAVRVVAHHLVEHECGVLRLVEQGVDVGLRQLGDAPEDRLLSHVSCLSLG
jgi:hypothetical protein